MTVREAPTTPATEPGRPPALSPVELAAWAWRQLTSMRVALILLFLLAVAAIPGSVVPQREINPLAVADFRERNPGWGSGTTGSACSMCTRRRGSRRSTWR